MRYVGQRVSRFLIVFFIVTFTVMVLLRLGLNSPGDPARTMLGGYPDEALIDATNAKYRLHSNYLVQYFHWLRLLVVERDFGFSVSNSLPVRTLIAKRIMVTVLLGVYAITLAVLIGVPLAVRQAYRRDRTFDKVASYGSFLFLAVPAIVLAVFLKLLFVEHWEFRPLGFLPALRGGGTFPRIADRVYPWDDLGQHVMNFALPALTLALPTAAVLSRLVRADMVLVLQSDFVSLAKAKGLSPTRILWRHALRNSMFSLLTSIGVQAGAIVGGSIVAEVFFDLDGMGSLLVVAVLSSDFFTVQAIVVLLVVAVVLTNLAVDLLYSAIDPRVKLASALK
jgi:peptide/nickel transport system permease protein